jgi:hypothetical protein
MGIFVQHPTDQQVWDSKVGSRAAYTRAYQAQERQQKLQTQMDANNTPDVTRRSDRFAPPDDPKIVAEHKRLRAVHQVAKGRVMHPAPVANVIPFLDPTSERQASEAYWWYGYKHTGGYIHGGDPREQGLLKFAKALHLIPYAAVFQGENDPCRQLTLKIIESAEAAKRFAGRY